MSSVDTRVALLLDAANCPSDARGTLDCNGSSNDIEDLKKELASLRLGDEPPRSRRGPWVVIAVLAFMVAASTIFGGATASSPRRRSRRRRRASRDREARRRERRS